MKTFSPWPATVAVLTILWLGPGCGGSMPEPEPELSTAPPPAPVEEPPARFEPAPPVVVAPPSPDPIHFAFNEYRITPSARLELEEVAVVMKENPDWQVVLEGHCDERGTEAYNLTLGENRAQAAKRYLASLGVDESRCTTISYGEERPLDPASNEEAWAANRRTEFRLHNSGS